MLIEVVVKQLTLAFAIICGIITVFFLLLPRNVIETLCNVLDKIYSTKHIEERLEAPIDLDSKVMGNRKVFGILSILVALVMFYLWFK